MKTQCSFVQHFEAFPTIKYLLFAVFFGTSRWKMTAIYLRCQYFGTKGPFTTTCRKTLIHTPAPHADSLQCFVTP